MKIIKKYILVICLLLISLNLKSQNIVFFLDSPSEDYYDFSWMDVSPPSQLYCLGNDLRNFPVEPEVKFQGRNSLLLKWRSMEGGDWSAIAATDGWQPEKLTGSLNLSFYIKSTDILSPDKLPKVFMEDIQNNKTTKISLSTFIHDTLKSGKWFHVGIPMDIFFNAPHKIDFTKVKTIGFAQDLADGEEHLLYVDNIKVFTTNDSGPISAPKGILGKGYDSHGYLKWNRNPENYCDGYKIYLSENGSDFNFRTYVLYSDSAYTDFTGKIGKNLNLKYYLTAVDNFGNESDSSQIISFSTHDMTDEDLLTMIQEATFRYFWDFAHPVSGMAREASDQDQDICATGGTGFGIMAILVGINRSFITHQEGLQRINKIVDFLQTADRFHGAWPHWINGNTGHVIPFSTIDNGGDVVETSYLIEGLLTARQYFNSEDSLESTVNKKITSLWEGVEWDWYTKNNGDAIYWHWSPNYAWDMNMPVRGYNEAMIVYLLAVASPTHPVNKALYQTGWVTPGYLNGNDYYGYLLAVGPDKSGPLFWTHYSFLGFDPRYKRDNYTNYFLNNVNWALIHRAYAIANPGKYVGYGSNCWGLTASYDPVNGYMAHDPNNDNGTISPTAAISSMPYTPQYSLETVKYFYRQLGDKIWGNLGLTDAFNQSEKWYASGYLAIDQGPIIDMIENYRTGLLWNKFMANPEIQPALDKMGFVTDSSSVLLGYESPTESGANITVFPNPAQTWVNIEISLFKEKNVSALLYDASGNKIDDVFSNQQFIAGKSSFHWTLDRFLPGVYYLQFISEKQSNYKKLVIL